jgi:hypothetical protein
VVIARVRALAQLTGLIALSQPAGQPKLGDVVSGIGQRTDQREGLLGSAPITKPRGKLPPGMIVATVGTLAHLIYLIVLGQAVRLPPLVGIARILGW